VTAKSLAVEPREVTTKPGRARVEGGILATVGDLLSPLSWWNDLLVNLPLAYAFATVVGLVSRPLFGPALVVDYWLTNVLGFVLLHVRGETVLRGERPSYDRRTLARDLLLSVGYTAVVVALVWLGGLTFPGWLVA